MAAAGREPERQQQPGGRRGGRSIVTARRAWPTRAWPVTGPGTAMAHERPGRR